MKVVAFTGSPRKNGNTAFSLKVVLRALEQAGIDTEFVQGGGHTLAGCRACGGGKKNGGHCGLPDDGMNGYIDKMKDCLLYTSGRKHSLLSPLDCPIAGADGLVNGGIAVHH